MGDSLAKLIDGLRGLFAWWVTIAPWEQALRVRFGKHVEVLGPGFHLRVPLMHRIYSQSTRLRTSDLGQQTVTTIDGQTVTICGVLRYRIVDLRQLYDQLHHAEATLVDLAMGLIAVYVAGNELADCTPRSIETFVNGTLDLARFGLEGDGLQLTDFAAAPTYRILGMDDRRYQPRHYLDTESHRIPGVVE